MIWFEFCSNFVLCSAIVVLSELWCSGSGGWGSCHVELDLNWWQRERFFAQMAYQISYLCKIAYFCKINCINSLFCKNNNPSYIWIIPTPVDCKNSLWYTDSLFYRLLVQHSLFLQNWLFVQCKNNGKEYLRRMYGTSQQSLSTRNCT